MSSRSVECWYFRSHTKLVMVIYYTIRGIQSPDGARPSFFNLFGYIGLFQSVSLSFSRTTIQRQCKEWDAGRGKARWMLSAGSRGCTALTTVLWVWNSFSQKMKASQTIIYEYICHIPMKKCVSKAIVWWRKHDNIFSRFDTVPACDRQTDGHTSSLYLLRASA